jgi:hypothetical protein
MRRALEVVEGAGTETMNSRVFPKGHPTRDVAGMKAFAWRERTMNRNLDVSEEPGDRVRLSGRCVVSGKPFSVVVPLSGAIDYFEGGRNIAEAFPDMPKPEREFLISGTSPEGWIRLFGSTTC